MSSRELKPSLIALLVGGMLAVVVQLPVINELLPIVTSDVSGIDGGINLLGGYGDVQSDTIEGWTMLELDGMIWWILLVVGGILCILPAIHKFQSFLPEMETIPGGLPSLLAIIGALLQIVITVLILIGDETDANAYGLNMLDTGDFWAVGFGFYVMLIAAIVSLVGAALSYYEQTTA
ncbi:MAG: hypothetical protein ACFFCQ_12565 [Promethearchaeota archaeon]